MLAFIRKHKSKPCVFWKETLKYISSKFLRVRLAFYNPLNLKIKVMYGNAKNWETFKTALAHQVYIS